MNIKTILVISLFAGVVGPLSLAMAETKFPDDMKMGDAIKNAISQVNKSDYKDMEITTTNGSVSGEYVKLAGNVLILKRKSGNINLKHQKERVQYILVDVNSIVGISFSTLD